MKNNNIYGKISKYAMNDRNLSCDSKAVYATITCFAGNKQIAYPTLETLCKILNIGKSRVQTIIWELCSQGYLKKGKMKSKGNFQRNTYEIVSCPPKYELEPENEKDIENYRKIRAEGIRSCCYGIVPQWVMTNSALNIKAKAIYALLCAYAGNTNTAYPTERAICYHLQMSENTYRKYLKELVDAGYVKVVRHRDEGRFSQSEYVLVGHPNEKAPSNYGANMARRNAEAKAYDGGKNHMTKTPPPKNEAIVQMFDNGNPACRRTGGTAKMSVTPPPKNDTIVQMFDYGIQTAKSAVTAPRKPRNTANIEHAQPTPIIPPVTTPSAKSPPPKNRAIKTNSNKTNIYNTNIPKVPISSLGYTNQNKNKKNKFSTQGNQSAPALNPKSAKNKKTNGLIDCTYDKNYIKKDLFEKNAINPEFLKSQSSARTVVDILTSGMKPCTSDYWHRTICTALAQMLYSGGNPEDRKYNPGKVAELVNAHIKTSAVDGSVYFDGWFDDFEKAFDKSVQKDSVSSNITYPIPYAKRSIWDSLAHYVSEEEMAGVPKRPSSFDNDDFFRRALARTDADRRKAREQEAVEDYGVKDYGDEKPFDDTVSGGIETPTGDLSDYEFTDIDEWLLDIG